MLICSVLIWVSPKMRRSLFGVPRQMIILNGRVYYRLDGHIYIYVYIFGAALLIMVAVACSQCFIRQPHVHLQRPPLPYCCAVEKVTTTRMIRLKNLQR